MILRSYTPGVSLYDIFTCLHREPDAVFLDSSLKNQFGKVSIAGFLPETKAEEKEGIFYLNEQPHAGDAMTWLRDYLASHQEENPTDLPFVSGGIGYLSYEFGKRFLGLPVNRKSEVSIPDFCFVFYRLYVIENVETGELTLAARDEEALQWLYDRERETRGWKKAPTLGENLGDAQVSSDFTCQEYKQAIEKMVDYIIAGDIYIANMTRQLKITSQADPYKVFQLLRSQNPSPFGGYFHYRDAEIISASPERFFELRNGTIRTRPIKGTRKRGETPQEDEALRLELQNSEKDKSELLMIVDLERNDLSRVCKTGSVQVEELFVTEAYATVFHLVSTIAGQLREDQDVTDVLRAMFPGGSITGAPKYRAMEIIEELEHSGRGLYTGSMGYIGFDGDCDFNIVIRTLVHQKDGYHIGAGGGITCESEPDFEYEETCQKAAAPIRGVQQAR